MRVGMLHQYDSYNRSIQQAYQRYFGAQQEVLTGKRQNLLENDPAGATFVLRGNALKTTIAQYDKNLRTATDYFGSSDVAFSEVSTMLKRASVLAIQGANATADQPSRTAMAKEIAQIQGRLAELANSKGQSGQYLFAGQANSAAPYSVVANALVYAGDNNSVVVESGPGQTMAVNTLAQNMFTGTYAALEALKNDLNSGNVANIGGADLGAIQNSLNAFNDERGNIGAKMSRVKDLTLALTKRTDELTAKIADTEEVDMAESIQTYRIAETAYSAALQVTAQSMRLSLMDFIR